MSLLRDGEFGNRPFGVDFNPYTEFWEMKKEQHYETGRSIESEGGLAKDYGTSAVTHCYVRHNSHAHNSHPSRMDITPHYHSLRLLLLDPELITAECCGDLGQDANDKEFEPYSVPARETNVFGQRFPCFGHLDKK